MLLLIRPLTIDNGKQNTLLVTYEKILHAKGVLERTRRKTHRSNWHDFI
jgi:hypothetical protein